MKKLLIFTALIASFLVACSKGDVAASDHSYRLDLSFEGGQVMVGEKFRITLKEGDMRDIRMVEWDLCDQTIIDEPVGEGLIKNLSITHVYNTANQYFVRAFIHFVDGSSTLASATITAIPDPNNDDSDHSGGSKLQAMESALNGGSTFVCGHRGFGEFAEENTIDAFKAAYAAEVDMIEIDLKKTKDGVLILMHDNTIDRTTNGTGSVKELTYPYINSCYIESAGTVTSMKVPTLKETLEYCKGKLYINLDMRDLDNSQFQEVYDLLKSYNMVDQTLVTAYDVEDYQTLMGIDPAWTISPTVYSADDVVKYQNVDQDLYMVQVNHKAFTAEVIKMLTDAGIKMFKNTYVNTSTTPTSNNYQEVRDFINAGGNIMQTDHPEEIKKYFKDNNL